jgi:hypothetical protein
MLRWDAIVPAPGNIPDPIISTFERPIVTRWKREADTIDTSTVLGKNKTMIKTNTQMEPTDGPVPPVVMTIVTDPDEVGKAKRQHERMRRNSDWLEAHATEVYQHRGKHFCIAGQELFIADTAEQAWAIGEAAHPEDDGMFVRYIPEKRLPRIYAHRRTLVSL